MIDLSFEAFAAMSAIAVLAGSMVGSMRVFLGDSGDEIDAAAGARPPWRPVVRQDMQLETAHYRAEPEPGPARRRSRLAVVLAGAIALLAGNAGHAIYKSPWSAGTDVRHFVATLHCDLAEQVSLAPAQAGAPGYHPRNDRDGNGIACETFAGALGYETGGTLTVGKLSAMPLSWPGSAEDAAASATR